MCAFRINGILVGPHGRADLPIIITHSMAHAVRRVGGKSHEKMDYFLICFYRFEPNHLSDPGQGLTCPLIDYILEITGNFPGRFLRRAIMRVSTWGCLSVEWETCRKGTSLHGTDILYGSRSTGKKTFYQAIFTFDL